MPKLNERQRQAIMAEVEQVMLKGLWSLNARNKLADRHNLNPRTISEYKARIQKAWLDANDIKDVEKERGLWKSKLAVAQQAALSKGDFKALSSLLRLEASVGGFEGFAIKQKVADTPMTEQEAVNELTAVPEHLLEAALAIARAKDAR